MTSPDDIPVRYSCNECGLKDATVPVPRRGPGLGIVLWMERVTHTLARDHSQRSPLCHPKVLTEIKVPLPATEAEGIGYSCSPPKAP